MMLQRYKEAWADPTYRRILPVATVVFVASLCTNFWAIAQATNRAGSAVPDIILSHIPTYEVDGLFVWGTALVLAFSFGLVLAKPQRIPFVFLGVALFIFIRSAFTLMTHLGPPEVEYISDFGATITNSFFGADQFFSAHTGMPFLGALAYWHLRRVRYAYLASSLFFAVVVLLGHIHYTIDVASAFFITYAIYHIALWLMPREHERFLRA